jgi:tRNA (cytidine/uridine-2'-O-)-methyltransferase
MLNIVLHNPEIPANTGNIGRTCVALNAKLHLIKPLGFDISDKAVKRAGLDYWNDLDLVVYENYEEFLNKNKTDKIFFLSRHGKYNYASVDYQVDTKNDENLFLVFGSESTGISKDILSENIESTVRIPMSDKVRSVNLSNCVFLIAYEAMKQNDFPDLLEYDHFKGKEFLYEK